MNCTKEKCRPRNVFEELDRGLNQFVREVLSTDARSSASPPVTLIELADRYRVECDLPGVVLDQINVSVEDSVLSISGTRNVGELPESAKMIVNERPAKEFSRSIRLAQNADVSQVDAELKDGVLTVTIPKRSEVLPKKIQIRRSGSDS